MSEKSVADFNAGESSMPFCCPFMCSACQCPFMMGGAYNSYAGASPFYSGMWSGVMPQNGIHVPFPEDQTDPER